MKALLEYIESKEGEMLEFLKRLVNIDSGSYDKAGVDQVGDVLAECLAALDFDVQRSPQKEFGDHVIGYKPGAGNERILFIGHMDTVFPAGTAQKRPFRMEGDRAFGPGVVDMKGGITCLIYALKALKGAAPEIYLQIAMDVVFNSDEEILSPTSKPIIESRARQAKAVCVFEPARPGGEYVIRRKGVGKYILRVTGRAAHAGAQPEDGRSAIEELAHKIIALHALTNAATGTNVNVGVIRGGERPNIIADEAYAEVDFRVADLQTEEGIEKRIREIAAAQTVPDTLCKLSGGIQFPPMLPTEESTKLFETLQKAGQILGLELRGIATGGGSDGNHAAQYAPTLDGMGPQGGGAHSDREYIETATLAERTKVTALFLAEWLKVEEKRRNLE
jgi:glutamate carboxypeptidase